MRAITLTAWVSIAVAGSVAVYSAVVPPPSGRHIVRATYTETQVLEFFFFSKGRVVADHPTLKTQGTTTVLSDEQVHTVAQTVSGCIHSIDAAAGPALTAAFNTADPQRLDDAARRFDAAAQKWRTAPGKPGDPCPPPPPPPSVHHDPGSGWWRANGYGLWNFIVGVDFFYGVAVTVGVLVATSDVVLVMGALLAAWAAVIAFILVPAIVSYEFENAPTDLDRQIAIAKLVQVLRS